MLDVLARAHLIEPAGLAGRRPESQAGYTSTAYGARETVEIIRPTRFKVNPDNSIELATRVPDIVSDGLDALN